MLAKTGPVSRDGISRQPVPERTPLAFLCQASSLGACPFLGTHHWVKSLSGRIRFIGRDKRQRPLEFFPLFEVGVKKPKDTIKIFI